MSENEKIPTWKELLEDTDQKIKDNPDDPRLLQRRMELARAIMDEDNRDDNHN
ncbi:MAG: hypothetical protein LBL08_03255 [Candidatus Nomurabacteria bacterium]|jgi:hypothetical protein|nr:hypothetical protein [Candidatus Nomurabacteria bacterium]